MTAHATAANAAPRTPGRRAPRGRRRRAALVTLVLAAALPLAACGVRLETPAPTEPSPDAHEIVRRTAVDDALAVSAIVSDVTPGVTDPDVLAVLAEAQDFADQHAQALGGEYDSGLADSPATEDGTSSAGSGGVTTTPPEDGAEDGGADGDEGGAATTGPDDATSDGSTAAEPTTDDVVVALVGAAQRTRASAGETQDGPLARLLASVATSEHDSALRLAALTGSTAAEDLPAGATPVEEAPSGVGAADLATLVEAEDAAGYAYEVRAALEDGGVRSDAVARAAQHRARAQGWALAAGTDGTAQDPRRTAYVLPDDEGTAALAQRLETELAGSYASLVATAAPASRADAVALLTDSWLAAVAWGASPVAFPGLPEQAGS